MPDTRMKNADWALNFNSKGIPNIKNAQLAVLMDIRDELKSLNHLLHCRNFVAIPRKLDMIAKKLPTRRRRSKSNA